MRLSKVLLAAMVGLALSLSACTGVASAQEGIVQQADAISGQIVIKLKEGGTITVNFQDVDIETLKKVAGRVSLEPGDEVRVEFDKDKRPQALKARVAEVEGTIKRVDKDKRTVTIDDEDRGEITLHITQQTRMETDDDDADGFDDLRAGQEVEAKFDVENMNALKIEIGEEEDEAEVEGTITTVNKDAKTVGIRAKNGTEATYKVTAATDLDLDDIGGFDRLKIGMKVEAKFNRDTKELIELDLED